MMESVFQTSIICPSVVQKVESFDLLKKTAFDLMTKVAKSYSLVKNNIFDHVKFDLRTNSQNIDLKTS
jgi:hypothetical protein